MSASTKNASPSPAKPASTTEAGGKRRRFIPWIYLIGGLMVVTCNHLPEVKSSPDLLLKVTQVGSSYAAMPATRSARSAYLSQSNDGGGAIWVGGGGGYQGGK